MTEFFSMGNYGSYVWSSYAITFGVLFLCVLQGRARHKRILGEVRRRIIAQESKA